MSRQPSQPMRSTDLPCRLHLLRLQAGLSQRRLAARLGVNAAMVSYWERGRVPINRRTELAWRGVCHNARQVARRRTRRIGLPSALPDAPGPPALLAAPQPMRG